MPNGSRNGSASRSTGTEGEGVRRDGRRLILVRHRSPRLKCSLTMEQDQNMIRGKRILLVDDEASVRGAFRMMLEFDDHTVTEANDGAEALELFSKGQFDLVSTDFEMPVMKGNALAVRIKTLSPKQPILMVTAHEIKLGDSENPVDRILNKPFTLEKLRGAIAELLSN
jgi:two-component system cell cycle response regulator CpdR